MCGVNRLRKNIVNWKISLSEKVFIDVYNLSVKIKFVIRVVSACRILKVWGIEK